MAAKKTQMVNKKQLYAALFFLALAVFICHQSMRIGVGTLLRPRPGLMSFVAGAGIGLLSLAFLIQILLGKGETSSEPSGEAERGGRMATIVAISVSLFVYTIAVNWLGFILATLLFVLFLFRTVETESWWRSMTKAVLVTLGNYLLFVVVLELQVPKGLLPW